MSESSGRWPRLFGIFAPELDLQVKICFELRRLLLQPINSARTMNSDRYNINNYINSNNNSSISQEKIKELKRLIDNQLRSSDVYGQIRSLLADFLNQNRETVSPSSEEGVFQALRQKGVLEQVIHTINGQGNRASVSNNDLISNPTIAPVSPATPQLHNLKNKKFLHFKLLAGKAFLEQPDEENVCHTCHLLLPSMCMTVIWFNHTILNII